MYWKTLYNKYQELDADRVQFFVGLDSIVLARLHKQPSLDENWDAKTKAASVPGNTSFIATEKVWRTGSSRVSAVVWFQRIELNDESNGEVRMTVEPLSIIKTGDTIHVGVENGSMYYCESPGRKVGTNGLGTSIRF